jgi:uncharacterized membrane protein YhaH (DUF805 family)
MNPTSDRSPPSTPIQIGRTLFSFKGEMNRLAFVGWLSALVMGTLVGTLCVIEVGRRVMAGGAVGSLALVLMLVLLLWPGTALMAKRFRHMGINPAAGVAAMFIGGPLVMAAGLFLPEGLAAHGALHKAWTYGAMAFLLLWPGRTRRDGPSEALAGVAAA